jgi:flagellar biosynthesis protein FlhF
MMVRRYVVKEMPEAVMQIRKELGKDAVILSTKKVTVRKWLGLWRQHRIEVVAAIGDDVPLSAVAASSKRQQGKPQSPVSRSSNRMDTSVVETGVSVEHLPGSSEVEGLRKELQEVRKLIEETVLHKGDGAGIGASFRETESSVIREVSEWLAGRGFSIEVAKKVTNEASQVGLGSANAIDFEGLKQRVVEVLRPRIQRIAAHQGPLRPHTHTIALVGPTGVGKTTTVAKLAALNVLSGKRVGLITTDTYRIAAVDQLRTYANILGVPLEVVYELEDAAAVVDRVSDCDVVLVDTAGRNYQNEENVSEIKGFLKALEVDEVLFVLSVTSKTEDLHALVAQFQDVQIDRFLFTKLDETSSHGAIVELAMTYDIPLSFVTNGQSVPDDIEIAKVDKIFNGVMGGAV